MSFSCWWSTKRQISPGLGLSLALCSGPQLLQTTATHLCLQGVAVFKVSLLVSVGASDELVNVGEHCVAGITPGLQERQGSTVESKLNIVLVTPGLEGIH